MDRGAGTVSLKLRRKIAEGCLRRSPLLITFCRVRGSSADADEMLRQSGRRYTVFAQRPRMLKKEVVLGSALVLRFQGAPGNPPAAEYFL